MDEFWSVPDAAYLTRIVSRLGAAAVFGGLIGLQREWAGKAAGLRTHIIVALGCAAFMLIAMEHRTGDGDISRVIQGIAAGIGFIGAGTILKREHQEDIKGLTSAASIWLTAAVGAAAGGGQIWLGLICVAIAFVILSIFSGVERWLARKRVES